MDPNYPIINSIPQYHIQHPKPNPVTDHNDLLNNHLHNFWHTQRVEIEQTNDFKTHALPLARIKRIMKLDQNVRMISAETPVLLSRACDMFIQDLTHRAWVSTERSRRRTLQKSDVSFAVSTSDLFDFLVDIVPREPVMPVLGVARNNEHQQLEVQRRECALGDGSSVGSAVGLDGGNEGSLSWLSHHFSWPPPHL
ncbi:hypothetical protein RND81_05G144300 [Saponaria officinalis]|uniref:Transcription factor CBF/NF-Y/archaeal histone domain-containing protein n=1 Tax=Saponaria officinalis TaxID=3572 RepID=A0AAW1L0Z6_SAPOF